MGGRRHRASAAVTRTALDGEADLKHFDRAFALTNRLRTEGTDNLIAAAKECGVRRFLAQSFCGWPYARTGGMVKCETDPLDAVPPAELGRSLAAIQYLERTVVAAQEFVGIVLRYGALYGPNTGILARSIIEQLRRRRMPLIGAGGGWWSFVHVDDAAEATALAVEKGEAGIYNVVDSDPAPVSEWLTSLAVLSSSPRPIRIPKWLARLAAGEHLVVMMTDARAGSNAKAKRELLWTLTYDSWRQGFAKVLVSL